MNETCLKTLRLLAKLSGRPLAELEGLASKALVGVVSSTYRTCGKERCRCMRRGEKHGPHLYVSYRGGEERRMTGFYVPRRHAQSVQEGLEAWAKLDRLLRRVARSQRKETHRGTWRGLRRPLRELAEAHSASLHGIVAQERGEGRRPAHARAGRGRSARPTGRRGRRGDREQRRGGPTPSGATDISEEQLHALKEAGVIDSLRRLLTELLNSTEGPPHEEA
jgi:hypothetical protein